MKNFLEKQMMIRTLFLFVLWFISLPASATYLAPNADFQPTDVLKIQLHALKNNDYPVKDFGIAQTYRFAHPDNRSVTGPFSRFKKMIYGENYKVLLNHKSHFFTLINKTPSNAIFKVIIVSRVGGTHNFIWNISKFSATGSLKNCWLTVSVSKPLTNKNSI